MTHPIFDSGLRLADEIRQQLAELVEIRTDLESGGDFGYAGLTHLASLKAHEADLREELRAAELVESNSTADFVLEGEPLRGHEIPARLLGEFLEKLQALAYAVGQSMAGPSTARSRVPKVIAAANRLYVQPNFIKGSFGFRVRVPEAQEYGNLIESDADASLQVVCQLLGDDDPAREMIELLSHSRVKSHYGAIVGMLAKENVDLSMRHRAVRSTMRLDSSQARKRTDWLSQLQIYEETIVRTGLLVGGNVERDQFELKSEDEFIRGRISRQAKLDLGHIHLGSAVVATLRVTQTEHEESIAGPTETYIAERFIPADNSPSSDELF